MKIAEENYFVFDHFQKVDQDSFKLSSIPIKQIYSNCRSPIFGQLLRKIKQINSIQGEDKINS